MSGARSRASCTTRSASQLSALLVGLSNLSAAIPASAAGELEPHVAGIRDLAQNCVRVIRNMALLLRPRCSTIWASCPRSNGRPAKYRERTASASMSRPIRSPTICRRVTRPAFTASSRRPCTTACGIPAPVLSASRSSRDRAKSTFCAGRWPRIPARSGERLGLVGIEERVTHLGGTLRIDSHAGSGTLLAITLPLTSRNHSEVQDQESCWLTTTS